MAVNPANNNKTALAGYTTQELQNFMKEDTAGNDAHSHEELEEAGDEDEGPNVKDLHLTKLVLTIAL